MNNDGEMLEFVKVRLEEGAGVSAEALSRILAAAADCRRGCSGRAHEPAVLRFPRVLLVAATLAIAACGWYVAHDAAHAQRASTVANVIALLNAAEGDRLDADMPLSDALCAWQDSPTSAVAD